MLLNWKIIFPNRVRKSLMGITEKLAIAMFAGGFLPLLSGGTLFKPRTIFSLALTAAFLMATLYLSYISQEEVSP